MIGRIFRNIMYLGGSAFLFLVAFLLVFNRFSMPDFSRFNSLSAEVVASDGTPLRSFLADDGRWRLRARIGDIDSHFIDALIAVEDKRFNHHYGVDPLAVIRATYQVLTRGRVISGASTITMQTARLLEPRPRRLIFKLIEMFRAFQIENRLYKEDILEVYLTLAPYGGNIEGIEAASEAWFGHDASHLRPEEIALLLALPQAPTSRRPDRHPENAIAARNNILGLMLEEGLIDDENFELAIAESIPIMRHSLPMLAPHLAERLHDEEPERHYIETSIDSNLQEQSQELSVRHLQSLGNEDLSLAVMVVENGTGRVLVHIGGADYFNLENAGMMDMTRAIRSPGSTLKPFIYAMGFEERLFHPETIYHDAPISFGSYSPRNFDNDWHGDVSLSRALQISLNTPAVAALEYVGPLNFIRSLEEAGARVYIPQGRPSLAVALGGLGTDLESLTGLYASLGNGGRAVSLNYNMVDNVAEDEGVERLVSGDTADEILGLLRGVPRPSIFPDSQFTEDNRTVAFKTGTSYGRRDSLAIGVRGDITIGVWVGRPDGEECPRCSGIASAAPLLFQIFDLIEPMPIENMPDEEEAGNMREFYELSALELPPHLRRLTTEIEILPQNVTPFNIISPLPDSIITLNPNGLDNDMSSIPIIVSGGKRPLNLIINDHVQSLNSLRRNFLWQQPNEGFYRVTIIDADGESASADYRIMRE